LISEKIKNKRILGLGVGLGLEELHLLKMGGNVIFLDLSIQMLKLARRGAGLYNLAPILINSNAHFLPFKSESFDMIIGTGILHHLNMEKAAPELARILVPNGKAIFIEPLEQPEPLVYLRAMIPVKWRESRGGGVLSKKDLFYLWKNFGRIKIRKFHVLESLCRISNWLEDRRKAISNIDRLLLTAFPLLGCFARAGVIEIQKIRK
jgi:ubiquinone/menaquinone biosynthesis C-methylase UbiE